MTYDLITYIFQVHQFNWDAMAFTAPIKIGY